MLMLVTSKDMHIVCILDCNSHRYIFCRLLPVQRKVWFCVINKKQDLFKK